MTENGQTAIGDFLFVLQGSKSVGIRLMIRRVDGDLSLYTSVATASPDAAEQPEFQHDYGDVLFAGGVVSGSAIASWIEGREGSLNGLTFSIPDISNVSWSRYPSRVPRRGHAMQWPRTDYRAYMSNRPDFTYQNGVLAGAGVPFFPTAPHAIAALLFDTWPEASDLSVPTELMTVHVAETSAWIRGVRVLPAAIFVDISGDDLMGVQLQVSNGAQHQDQPLTEPGEIHIPMAYSESNDLWIALTGETRWLDYREVRNQWQAPSAEAGVTFETDELSEQVNRIRLGGESEVVEFKERVSPKDEDLAKTVAAFANAAGGTILIGVRDKTGEVVGIKDDLPGVRDRVQNIIRNRLRPLPPYQMYDCKIEHQDLLVVRVEPGGDWPYGIGQVQSDYYVRRGATTWRAQSEDIRAVVQSRLQIQQGRRPWFWPR